MSFLRVGFSGKRDEDPVEEEKHNKESSKGWVPAIDSPFHLVFTSGPRFSVCEGGYIISIEPFYSSCPETITCSEKRKDVKRSEDRREIKENRREQSLTTHKHTRTHTHTTIEDKQGIRSKSWRPLKKQKKSVCALSYMKTFQAHVFVLKPFPVSRCALLWVCVSDWCVLWVSVVLADPLIWTHYTSQPRILPYAVTQAKHTECCYTKQH